MLALTLLYIPELCLILAKNCLKFYEKIVLPILLIAVKNC